MLGYFDKVPMPPSVNQAYVNAGKKRVASSQLRLFKKECMLWACKNRDEITTAKKKISQFIDRGYEISLSFRFFFPEEKLFTKKGKAKKIDTSNRIKSAEDAICRILDFDDKYVFELKAVKELGPTECFSVIVSPIDIKF
jgi:ADP-dependent phosphofructokinase/glucokinase